jgi:hypothetical protein
MELVPMYLRLETTDGSGIEEYRIREGEIEVRRAQRPSQEWQFEDAWNRLSAADLTAHVQKNTVVAQWLKHRIGWKRLLMACTDKETLQKFGVPDAIDRYAA